VVGMEGEVVTTQDIFVFHKTGIDAQSRVLGCHVPIGVRPHFMERLRSSGIHLAPEIFSHPEEAGP